MSEDFEFLICSPPDREKLIYEIYHNGEIFGEISQETDEMIVEIYPSEKSGYWQFTLQQLRKVLEGAEQHLKGN